MDIIAAQHPALLEWAGRELDTSWSPSPVHWLSGVAGDRVVFVVVYSAFSERNCMLSIATDGTKRWASRKSLRAIFHVPFNQWNLARVSFLVRFDNEKSLDLCRRLGAHIEGYVRRAFSEGDGVMFGMLKEECRWIN